VTYFHLLYDAEHPAEFFFSERELVFAVARPSVVCNVRAPYSGGSNFVAGDKLDQFELICNIHIYTYEGGAFSAFACQGRHAMRAPAQAACRQPAQLNAPLVP